MKEPSLLFTSNASILLLSRGECITQMSDLEDYLSCMRKGRDTRRIPALLSAIRATAAAIGDFPLFTILVYVADEHPAFEAGTRTL